MSEPTLSAANTKAPPAAGKDQGLPSTARFAPALMTESRDRADINDATDANDPIDSIDAAEPTDPIDATDPIEPIDKTEPRQPMHSNESSDHNDHVELMRRTLRGGAYGQLTRN